MRTYNTVYIYITLCVGVRAGTFETRNEHVRDAAGVLGTAEAMHATAHTIWLFNSLPWKDPPFLIGKASINRPSIPWLC